MLLQRKSRPGHAERAIFTCPGRYRRPRQKPRGPVLSKHVLPAPFTPWHGAGPGEGGVGGWQMGVLSSAEG